MSNVISTYYIQPYTISWAMAHQYGVNKESKSSMNGNDPTEVLWQGLATSNSKDTTYGNDKTKHYYELH